MKYKFRRGSSITTVCRQIGAVSLLLLLAACASKKVQVQQFYTLQSMVSGEEVVQGSVGLANAKLRISTIEK